MTEFPDAVVDPNVYFAAERTLLAWIRTALAMMGFGFVVARFGIFLRQIAAVRGMEGPIEGEDVLSLWTGSGLVVLGIVILLAAALRYARTIRSLRRGERIDPHPFSAAVALAVVIAVVGIVIAVFLLRDIVNV